MDDIAVDRARTAEHCDEGAESPSLPRGPPIAAPLDDRLGRDPPSEGRPARVPGLEATLVERFDSEPFPDFSAK